MRCGCIFGVASLVSFAVFMAGAFLATDIPPLKSALEDWHCKPYQYIERVTRPTSDGTSIHYYCRDVEVLRNEITGQVILSMTGISAALFGALVIVLRIASAFIPQRVMPAFSAVGVQTPADLQTQLDRVNVAVAHVDLPPETLQTLRQALTTLVHMKGQIMAEDDTLADKLEQLQEARDRGLISPQEYDTIRQAILDRMDD